MNDRDAREKLVEFLDKNVFDPILRRGRDGLSADAEKRKLDDVKRSTESEKRRFHEDYRSAEEIRRNYLSDLSSETGKRKSKELEDLGLPTLPQFKEEFLGLCSKLGVSP
jgi:hypothetical protein